MEVGSPVAPAAAGGSGSNAGAVISSQPGPKVGLPTTGGNGSLSLSPAGGDKPGLGGAGGGTGIGRGDGTGSGVKNAGPGAGKTGTERGADPDAHGGISPNPGPGGAGNATAGTPPVPGVSVSGGNTSVTLPSFGSDPAANDPRAPVRSSTKHGATFDVSVVATANSGGAFAPYKNLLHGEKGTKYLDTSAGTVVMEYADEAATGNSFGGSLKEPQSLRTTLPEGLPRAHLMITCTLDASGDLKNVRVLEPGPADMTAKVVAALRSWKFQPAMRGEQPVEVTAILGFNIDTNDRF
jgi:TonB family protein